MKLQKDTMDLLNGTWKGFYVQCGKRHSQSMNINYLPKDGNGGMMNGFGADALGEFDVHGIFIFQSVGSQFNLTFEKKYRQAHSIFYSATIPLNNRSIMSGKWSFNQDGSKVDEFYLTKCSGN